MDNFNFKEVLDSLLPYVNSELHSRVLLHFVFIIPVIIKLNVQSNLTLSWVSIFIIQIAILLAFDWKLRRVFKESK